MIPADLASRAIELPDGERTIIVITGNELRHERLALRLQYEFGQLVVAWFQVQPPAGVKSSPTPRSARLRRIRQLARHPRRTTRLLRTRSTRVPLTTATVETRLFGEEVESLRERAHLQPQPVADPNAQLFVAQVRALDPYVLVTMGGAIYGEPLLACVRGLALNQHSGWCPEYRGSNTVDWTLYRRDIRHLGSTVHVLTSTLDAGPIVRRSTACVIEDDTLESCFARVVAVGTELMCEVVSEIIRGDRILVCDQPEDDGHTYIAKDMTAGVRRTLDADRESRALRVELARLREF